MGYYCSSFCTHDLGQDSTIQTSSSVNKSAVLFLQHNKPVCIVLVLQYNINIQLQNLPFLMDTQLRLLYHHLIP